MRRLQVLVGLVTAVLVLPIASGVAPRAAAASPPVSIFFASGGIVAENSAVGTTAGSLGAVDDFGDTHTFALVSGTGGTHNSQFTIAGNLLKTGAVFNYEGRKTYSIRVRATDQGNLFHEQVMSVEVADEQEAPLTIALSNSGNVLENKPAHTLVGRMSTKDDAGDTHTYTLVPGSGDGNNSQFEVVDNRLQTATVFDFESQSSAAVRVRSTDQGGRFVEQPLTVNVLDANDAPTHIFSTTSQMPENTTGLAGSFWTIDPDATDSHTYTLASGPGDRDNAAFQISGDLIYVVRDLDREVNEQALFLVRSTDLAGAFVDQAFAITVTDAPEAPSGITRDGDKVVENAPVGTRVFTMNALDQDVPDAGQHTFALVSGTGGTHNSLFEIVGNEVRTKAVFDFETRNNYTIRVRVTDPTGNTYETTFPIGVTDLNEAPRYFSLSNGGRVLEARPVGTPVGGFTTKDDANNTHTYALVPGTGSTDNALFKLVGNQLQTNAVLDYETATTHSVRVRSTDQGGLTFEQPFAITVLPVNEGPTFISLSPGVVVENAPSGTVAGLLGADDQDVGDTHTFTLVAGTGGVDNAKFSIVGNELRTTEPLNTEEKNERSVRVRATDAAGRSLDQVLRISVADVNERPTDLKLSSNTIPENSSSTIPVGVLSTTDPDLDNNPSFELVAGTGSTDNAKFHLDVNVLYSNAPLDYETKKTLSIRVRAYDNEFILDKALTILVTDVNETPTGFTISNGASVNENRPVGTRVGVFSTSDPDANETFTYEFAPGTGSTDNGKFTISGNQLLTNQVFDFETESAYSVRVATIDSAGNRRELPGQVRVVNVNEKPTGLSLDNDSIAESSPAGSLVGNLSTADPDLTDSHVYTLVSGSGSADNASFKIVGDQLQSNATFDFETKQSYSVRIRTTDAGGLSAERIFTIRVLDGGDRPSDITLSNATIEEDHAPSSNVGYFQAIDTDVGDTYTYALVPGSGSTNNTSFTISGNQLVTNEVFDREAKSTYSIRVRATDSTGLSVDKAFTITVTNINEVPLDIGLSNAQSIYENKPVGTVVGTFSTRDTDKSDTHTYSLVPGTGSTDNDRFSITSNRLFSRETFNFEATPAFSIRVRTTDAGGLIYEEALTINVLNVNEPPDLLELSAPPIPEDGSAGLVGTFDIHDPEDEDASSLSLVEGDGSDDNFRFYIPAGSTNLYTIFPVDYETKNQYSIRVRLTDQQGLWIEKSFTLLVEDGPN